MGSGGILRHTTAPATRRPFPPCHLQNTTTTMTWTGGLGQTKRLLLLVSLGADGSGGNFPSLAECFLFFIPGGDENQYKPCIAQPSSQPKDYQGPSVGLHHSVSFPHSINEQLLTHRHTLCSRKKKTSAIDVFDYGREFVCLKENKHTMDGCRHLHTQTRKTKKFKNSQVIYYTHIHISLNKNIVCVCVRARADVNFSIHA